MKVGIPREVKNHEYRVAITLLACTSSSATATIPVERDAEGLLDPQRGLCLGRRLHPRHGRRRVGGSGPHPEGEGADRRGVLPDARGTGPTTYLHLAADKALTEELVACKVTGIAYETVELPDRSLPLLAPMSEVAGRPPPRSAR